MSFIGTTLVLDEWLAVGGGRVCNLTAAKAFSSQPLGESQGPGAPPEQESIFLWYKADAQSFSNGDLADPILDSGPNGFHLNSHGNPPGFQEPHFYTNVLNGLPVFRWNQTDLIFRNITSFNPAGLTYMMVVRKTALGGSGVFIAPFASATVQYQLRLFDDGASSRFQGQSATLTVSLTVPLGEWQIVSFTMDDAEGIPRLKTNILSAAGAAEPGSENIVQTRLQFVNAGEVAEAIGWIKKLSDSSLHDGRAYLSAKYNIPIL